MPSVNPGVLAEKQRHKHANHTAHLSQAHSSQPPSGPSSIPFPTFDNGMTLLIISSTLLPRVAFTAPSTPPMPSQCLFSQLTPATPPFSPAS